MNNIVNEPPQNENITFNNQLINDVINFCNNKEKDKLTNIISPLHPAGEKVPVGICQAYVVYQEYTYILQSFQPLAIKIL